LITEGSVAAPLERGDSMPVFSYVAIPRAGAKDTLSEELGAIEYCEVTPAENDEVLLLVTDSPDQGAEERLQVSLKALTSLDSLHMSFGCNDA